VLVSRRDGAWAGTWCGRIEIARGIGLRVAELFSMPSGFLSRAKQLVDAVTDREMHATVQLLIVCKALVGGRSIGKLAHNRVLNNAVRLRIHESTARPEFALGVFKQHVHQRAKSSALSRGVAGLEVSKDLRLLAVFHGRSDRVVDFS